MRGRMVIHSGLCVSDHPLDKMTATIRLSPIVFFYLSILYIHYLIIYFYLFSLYIIYFILRCAPVASLDSAL